MHRARSFDKNGKTSGIFLEKMPKAKILCKACLTLYAKHAMLKMQSELCRKGVSHENEDRGTAKGAKAIPGGAGAGGGRHPADHHLHRGGQIRGVPAAGL